MQSDVDEETLSLLEELAVTDQQNGQDLKQFKNDLRALEMKRLQQLREKQRKEALKKKHTRLLNRKLRAAGGKVGKAKGKGKGKRPAGEPEAPDAMPSKVPRTADVASSSADGGDLVQPMIPVQARAIPQPTGD